MTHLTPDELVDAAETTLATDRQAHLRSCEVCRRQVNQMVTVLREVQGVEVPEPSPLFWDHLSDRVRIALAAEADLPPRPTRWFHWPVLVPLGAVAALVMALASAVPHETAVPPDETLLADASVAPLPAAAVDAEEHWEMLAALVGGVDFDDAAQAGIGTAPGAADEAVLELTSAEQQELLRLLQEELGSGG